MMGHATINPVTKNPVSMKFAMMLSFSSSYPRSFIVVPVVEYLFGVPMVGKFDGFYLWRENGPCQS
jgi:hypothetical protein